MNILTSNPIVPAHGPTPTCALTLTGSFTFDCAVSCQPIGNCGHCVASQRAKLAAKAALTETAQALIALSGSAFGTRPSLFDARLLNRLPRMVVLEPGRQISSDRIAAEVNSVANFCLSLNQNRFSARRVGTESQTASAFQAIISAFLPTDPSLVMSSDHSALEAMCQPIGAQFVAHSVTYETTFSN